MPVTIRSDLDDDGSGAFTMASSKTLTSNDNAIDIASSDLVISGALSSGTAAMTLQATGGQRMSVMHGLGNSANYEVTTTEFDYLTASSLTLGGDSTGDIYINYLDTAHTNDVGRDVTLKAFADGSEIVIGSTKVYLDAFAASADNGITLSNDVETTVGDLTLDADYDNADDGSDSLNLPNSFDAISKGDLYLDASEATAGIIPQSGLNLSARGDIRIDSHIDYNGTFNIRPDNNNDGIGDLYIGAGSVINTNDSNMTIYANDVHLDGEFNVGAANNLYFYASDGGNMAIGDTTSDFSLSGSEIGNITAYRLRIGSAVDDIKVGSITDTQIGAIEEVELYANTVGGDVEFVAGSDSTFNRLEIYAYDGATLNGSTTIKSSSHFDLDNDNDGDGDFNIASGDSLTLTGDSLKVISNDVDIAGSIDATGKELIFTSSDAATVGLGLADYEYDLSNSELNAITAATLQIGVNASGEYTGDFYIDGVTEASTDTIDEIKLISRNGSNSQLHFENNASVFGRQLYAESNNNININANFQAIDGFNLIADADFNTSGSDVIGAGLTLDGGPNGIVLKGADLVLNGAITTTGNVLIASTNNINIGVGENLSGFSYQVSDAELQNLTAANLTIGDADTGNIYIRGLATEDTANISELVSIEAIRDDRNIYFDDTASTFKTLSAVADRGVYVYKDLSTTVGDLTLNGDYDNSGDGFDRVYFSGAPTVSSNEDLILSSQSGGIRTNSAVNLHANKDVVMNHGFYHEGTGDIVISADHDESGAFGEEGDFIFNSGNFDATHNKIQIYADDVTIDGTITRAGGGVELCLSKFW